MPLHRTRYMQPERGKKYVAKAQVDVIKMLIARVTRRERARMHYQAVKSERSREYERSVYTSSRNLALEPGKIRNRYSNEFSVCRFSFVRGNNEFGKEKAPRAKITVKPRGRSRGVRRRDKKEEAEEEDAEGRSRKRRQSLVGRAVLTLLSRRNVI